MTKVLPIGLPKIKRNHDTLEEYKASKDKQLAEGLAILRAKGVNFKRFKELMSRHIYFERKFSEDYWVHLYNDYAEELPVYRKTIWEFVLFRMDDWTLDKHSAILKKNMTYRQKAILKKV